jgi:hypothetical protein
MIEFIKNAASTRYVIFVNQNCSDPLRRGAANTRQTLFACSRSALRRCSLTFAVLVRSCGLGLVVDCALIAHGADGGKGIGRFILDTSGGSIILNASIFTCSVLLSVGSTGRGQGPTSTQNNLGLLLGPNLSLGLLDCHLLAHNPLGAENAAVPRLDVLSLRLHRL